jgi:hypothetical protein
MKRRTSKGEMQRLSGLKVAYDFQHAALVSLNAAYAAGGEPPVVMLPTWRWSGTETSDPDVYRKDVALALCRRGHHRYSLLNREDKVETMFQLEIFPIREARRVDVLQQLQVRYGDWIRSEITSAVLVQAGDSITLEIRTWLGGDRMERIDLSGYFDPADPIELNVAEFLRWGEDYMIMCTNLLEEEAARAIAISLGYADEEDVFDF